jgi:PTS system nitrogen regulatory IIA component
MGCPHARNALMGVAEAKPSPSMTNRELLAYLHPDLFIPDLKASGKNEAIDRMVAHLVQKNRVRDGKILSEALKTREKLGSTAIGKGVAIPHSRSTVTAALTLLYARSVDGVEFDAVDNKPVHLFFMILAPHQERENAYLPLLGKVVEVTKEATARRKLLKADDLEALKAAIEQVKAK